MKKIQLELTVFICGAMVMVYEIAGSRVLGPYMGTSIFVWTALIGVIMASLSIGYWLGGRMSDKNPTHRKLATIILSASVLVALLNLAKGIVLAYIQSHIMDIRLGALVSGIVLFAAPSVLLGMVSPYAIKLKLQSLQQAGKTVGNLYAISTVGSIVGTFSAGFFLIPLLGTTMIIYTIAGILFLTPLLMLDKIKAFFKKGSDRFYFLFLLILVVGWNCRPQDPNPYFDFDTRYSRVWVYNGTDPKTGKPIKHMQIGNQFGSAMFLDSDELVYEYSKYYYLGEHFCPDFTDAMMLGGAAYSFPKAFLKRYPEARLDVVEIDPGVTKIAREHFRLKNDPRLNIIHEDGRTFLNRNEKQYDIIYGDAFRAMYSVPFQLVTIEAVEKMYNSLKPGGLIILNTISSLKGGGNFFLRSEYKTYKEFFPHVYLFPVESLEDEELIQNVVLLALKNPKTPEMQSKNPLFSRLFSMSYPPNNIESVPCLTDDFAPVDYMVRD